MCALRMSRRPREVQGAENSAAHFSQLWGTAKEKATSAPSTFRLRGTRRAHPRGDGAAKMSHGKWPTSVADLAVGAFLA